MGSWDIGFTFLCFVIWHRATGRMLRPVGAGRSLRKPGGQAYRQIGGLGCGSWLAVFVGFFELNGPFFPIIRYACKACNWHVAPFQADGADTYILSEVVLYVRVGVGKGAHADAPFLLGQFGSCFSWKLVPAYSSLASCHVPWLCSQLNLALRYCTSLGLLGSVLNRPKNSLSVSLGLTRVLAICGLLSACCA